MISVAFPVDEIPFVDGEPHALRGYARKFVDKWCAMAGMTPIWIDETQTLRKTNGNVFYTWTEMLESLSDHRFVFLDSGGGLFLDQMQHPERNVIYCVGYDREEGFPGVDLGEQETVRMRRAGQWHGFTVVPIIAAERMRA